MGLLLVAGNYDMVCQLSDVSLNFAVFIFSATSTPLFHHDYSDSSPDMFRNLISEFGGIR